MLLLGASIFFLGACEQKNRIDDLKDFIEKIKNEGSSYTEKQWEEANEEFSKLLEKIESYEDLTTEELQEVAKLQGEYAANAFKNQAGEALEKAGAVIDGFLEGLSGDDKEDAEKEEER